MGPYGMCSLFVALLMLQVEKVWPTLKHETPDASKPYICHPFYKAVTAKNIRDLLLFGNVPAIRYRFLFEYKV